MELQVAETVIIPMLAEQVGADQEAMKWLASYSDPVKWANSLSNYRQTLTIHDDNSIVGFIDLGYKETFEIVAMDYCIFPEFRGQGKAQALMKTLHHWLKDNTRTRSLIAYVDPLNVPSVKTFERAGYINQGKVAWGLLLYTYYIH